MIVYNDIKRQFVNDVKDNSIADKILDAIKMRGLNAGHVTKNSAPREALLKLLSKSYAKKLVNIKQLFRSPFKYAHRNFLRKTKSAI